LGLQEWEVGEERGDLVAARGRDELEQQTSLVAAPLVEAHSPSMLPSVSCRTCRLRAPDSSADSSSRPRPRRRMPTATAR